MRVHDFDEVVKRRGTDSKKYNPVFLSGRCDSHVDRRCRFFKPGASGKGNL